MVDKSSSLALWLVFGIKVVISAILLEKNMLEVLLLKTYDLAYFIESVCPKFGL